MLDYFCNALYSFRDVFSRQSTWVIFCMVIIGFIGGSEMMGVTSFCRFWGVDVNGYYTFLHFFRYSSWSLEMLIRQWTTFVLVQAVTVMVQGRAVLFGDHTYVPKDGRRMPGVVTLHQDSETQSKPSYFRGHQWGAICLMIGSLLAPFGLPLALGIHQGLSHIDKENETDEDQDNLKTRIVQMALDFSLRHNLPCILTLDAYFPCASVFHFAYSIWSIDLKAPLVTLIIRAKKNCVAYYEAEKIAGKKPPGRPAKYGEKVKLTDFFDKPHLFSKKQCQVYGKVEEISIMAINLLWRPTGNLIRFVLATTSRGAIVLMCSDLNQNPLKAIRLYCARTRIEIMFDMLKNLIGAFCYRFWSKLMPRHSRKPKKNKDLKKPSTKNIEKVRLCWNAYERFTMLAAISLGILQLIALKFPGEIWKGYDGFLRTRSRKLPSERTVKHVIARRLIGNFFIIAPIAIMRKIRKRYLGEKSHSHHNAPMECVNSG
jgi:hypothetical protein